MRQIRKDPRLTEMAAVHLPPPPSDRGDGSSSNPPAAQSKTEVIKVDDNKAVLVISPAIVYEMKGEVHVFRADIVQAVDEYKLLDGYRREACR